MDQFGSGTFDNAGFGPPVRVGSQASGRNPQAALCCGVWPLGEGGDDNYYANTILPTGLQVTDTAAEASLGQLHTDLATTLHGDLTTTNSDLSQLHTDLATTLHTDLATTLHGDLTTTNSDLSTIANNTAVVAPPGHIRCFQQTPNGATTGALAIVPASVDGRGKKITNASVQGAAAGVDMWLGPAGVTNLTGDYLAPGAVASYSGLEAIYVYATAPGGICTASEEYT